MPVLWRISFRQASVRLAVRAVAAPGGASAVARTTPSPLSGRGPRGAPRARVSCVLVLLMRADAGPAPARPWSRAPRSPVAARLVSQTLRFTAAASARLSSLVSRLRARALSADPRLDMHAAAARVPTDVTADSAVGGPRGRNHGRRHIACIRTHGSWTCMEKRLRSKATPPLITVRSR